MSRGFDFDDGPPIRRSRSEVGHGTSAFKTMFGGVLGCFFGLLVIAVGIVLLSVWSCGRIVDGVSAITPDGSTEPVYGKPVDGTRAIAGKELATLGAVSVGITSAEVSKPRWEEFGREAESKEELLVLKITIKTKDPTKKIHYRTWRNSDFLSDTAAKSWDNFGNRNKRLELGIFGKLEGAVDTATVTKDDAAADVILFDKPLAAATHIDLDLPGTAVGLKSTDVFRFRILREMWAPLPAAKVQPPKKK